MSFFDSIALLPEDPIFKLPILFHQDARSHKVNLGIGSYQDAEGKPLILASVKKAEAALLNQERVKEYLPISGMPTYIEKTTRLIFGCCLEEGSHSHFAAQTVGGTGALRAGSEFLAQEVSKNIFIPRPTWSNHQRIFNRAGMNVHMYTYYDEALHAIDFLGLCRDICAMPPGSVILLHPCCHNPTGMDLSLEQWKEMSQLIKKHQLISFFDFAYQGFKKDVDEDAWPIRYFVSQGHELFVASSFSKNFGLYGERVGALNVVLHRQEIAVKVGSHIKQIIRSSYSNPPIHGAEIVSFILSSDELKEEWLQELAIMRERMVAMRHAFFLGLHQQIPERDWSYMKRQHGFFSYTGLIPEQVQRLIQDYGIYMPSDGRINVAGLNKDNLDYIISSIVDVIRS